MRKRGSRRKTSASNNPGTQGGVSIPGGPADSSNDCGSCIPAKKPVSPEEVALTAKNYRLAKELSDLRIRHREETKTVTRLTMENMNLASRCRQAMAHAEMLKKELVIQQKKTVELAQRHRKNGNGPKRYPLELSTSSNSADDDGRHPMNTKNHLPQDNGKSPNRHSSNSRAKSREIITMGTGNNIHGRSDYHAALNGNGIHNNQKSTSGVVSASKENESGRIVARNAKISTGDGKDVAFGELHSADFFTETYENTLPATPEKENVDMATMRDNFQSFKLEESIGENASNDENSYDAFEASFQSFHTNFPNSFVQTTSDRNLGLEEIFNGSDSFFADATPNGPPNTARDEATNDSSRGRSPPPPHMSATKSKKDRISREISSSPFKKKLASSPDDELTLFPDVNSFESSTTDSTMSTPSPKGKINGKDNDNLHPPSPPSDKQSGGAAARARYKYALSDTEDENIAPMDEAQADKVETSPTLVLQRLHQRKAREKTNGRSISPDNESNGNGRTSISEEIRKLDAIANGAHTRVKPVGRRRGVKQPISYTEPSLNSKLRRGDVFFPKNDGVENEGKSNATLTS